MFAQQDRVGEARGGRDLVDGEFGRFEQVAGVVDAALGDPFVGAAMFEFFQNRDVMALDRDLSALRALHPGLLDFETWLRETGWDGSEQAAQKFPRRLAAS
nr:hypothetical protein [Nocardia pseudobrasiliensis]